MKVLIQRVKESSVTIDNSLYSSIKNGILSELKKAIQMNKFKKWLKK